MHLVLLRPAEAPIAFTAGLALISFECNRPGMILPGCAGLLTVLVSTASLYRAPFHLLPAVVLASCLAALLLHTRVRLAKGDGVIGVVLTVACVGAWRLLFSGPDRIPWTVAIVCGLTTGTLGWFLTGIALRARQAKALPKAIN